MRRIRIGFAALLLLLCGQGAKAEWPSVLDPRDIAKEGFIYGFPIMTNHAVMYESALDREPGPA